MLVSIDTQATNTFDKYSYLNLNQPYNWNNPQSYYKKDNQATTLLKQVGGIVRNALGSTDSDNAGELVSKITTGIKSQLQTQAISTTEDIINDKANRLVNRFGSGRSEVSLHGLNSKELDYSIKTIQPISDLDANSKDLTFVQAQLSSDDNQGDRRRTINLGVGHRMLVDNDMAIAGINMFHDYESKSAHERLSLGLEYNRSNFGISANTYHALSDKKTINNATEKALSGYDIRLTGQAPYLPWATIKGTNYSYDASVGNNIKGNVVGVEVELTPSISFEFGQQNDNNINSQSYGKLNVKLPLGDNEQLTNFAIDDKPFKASSKMNLSDFAWVERDNKIQVEKIEQVEEVATSMTAYSITYRAITIGTQTWTAENMRHRGSSNRGNTRNYGDQVTNLPYNNDGYGLLYDWEAAMNGSTTEGAQGICGQGWHIPTDNDWKILEGYLGMTKTEQDNRRFRGTDQGAQLQVGGSSGFEALLAGIYNALNNLSYRRGIEGWFWTSTVSQSNSYYYRQLLDYNDQIVRSPTSERKISVRCIKN